MRMSIGIRLCCSFLISCKSYLSQLNLFKSGTQDEHTLQGECRSTRFYLVLLTFYHLITSHTKTIVIESLSFSKYRTLVQQTSLQSPCSRITVTNGQFVHIELECYEVCQSDFVSDGWINYLYNLFEYS